MFGAAAIYGAVTKRSLASIGGILFMGLIGLLVAMVLNIFLKSSELVVAHLARRRRALHGPDRLRRPAHPVGRPRRATGSIEKAAVIGALQLYLDFINLFLFLLRLFGGRN